MKIRFVCLNVVMLIFSWCNFGNAAKPDCAKFLSAYLPFAAALPYPIVLSTGFLASPAAKVLNSPSQVQQYLSENPQYPWTAELSALVAAGFDSQHLVFLSEVGPSLWRAAEYSTWLDLNTSAVGKMPDFSEDLLMRMAHGESVGGFSTFAHERMRNAFLASMSGKLADWEAFLEQTGIAGVDLVQPQHPHEEAATAFLNQFLTPAPAKEVLDPFTGEPLDFRKVAPEDHKILRFASANINRAMSNTRMAAQMRESSPSLRIDFNFDPNKPALRKMKTEADLYRINVAPDILWIARILLREPLVRRTITLDSSANLQTLDERVDDDLIFLLAAFPELVPHWEVAAPWPNNIRHLPLRTQSSFNELPELTFNAENDQCRVHISRTAWKERIDPEALDFNFSLTTQNLENFDCNFINSAEQGRFRNWFETEWAGYAEAVGLRGKKNFGLSAWRKQTPKLVVDKDKSKMTVDSRSVAGPQLLGFYVYLFNKMAVAGSR